MEKVPIGQLGLIVAGPEEGRVIEVVDDSEATGGYLIFTYSDFDRSPEIFDVWVESYEDVLASFGETGWRVEWKGPFDNP
jgi:hypothetical protein